MSALPQREARGALRVLMVSAEAMPYARTGGLGDAVAGLSSMLADLGADVAIVMPRYGVSRAPPTSTWWHEPVTVRIGWDDVRTLGVLATPPRLSTSGGQVCAFLLDHAILFGRDGIYGDAHGPFGDNELRFAAMSRGALAVADRLWPDGHGAEIVHAHDWHAAPAILASQLDDRPAWRRRKTVFTIHNLAFQGAFGRGDLDRMALPLASFDDGTLAHDGQVNLMRGAIALADSVTTVSPTYAREIQTPQEGRGLDGVLRAYRSKLVGILNGIDDAAFDPATDAALIARYDATSPFEGKAACKHALARELGLGDEEGPLFAAVSRLTAQKGVDLLLEILPALVERGARFVLVGSGEPYLERGLVAAAERYPGRVASRIAFDEALARRVYAGADFFVVPSRYEPCGLTQLYAMRYGAIPVVTAVGGLRDTVDPIRSAFDAGTGWVAPRVDPCALLVACEDALVLHADTVSHRAAVLRAMGRDSSWRAPARAYLDLYQALLP